MDNWMLGLERFVLSWDRVPEVSEILPIRLGARGHRNLTGTPEGPSIVFAKHHPQFGESLEGGVRDLVQSLIRHFDCVTYSSCEGHLTDDGTNILCSRNVAILSRNSGEHQALLERLAKAITQVRTPTKYMVLQVHEEILETET